MKSLLLFLMTILEVTAALYVRSASQECEVQHFLLKEIIENVNGIKGKGLHENSHISVKNVITPEKCTLNNFCKAGTILSAYPTKEFGLKDWLLPRRLVAYSRNIHCTVNSLGDQVEFLQLLENIKLCAQKKYTEICNGTVAHSN